MTDKTEKLINKLNQLEITAENEDPIRSLICDLLASHPGENREDILSVCRKKLRKLQNEKSRKLKNCLMHQVDLGALFQNVCIASDALLSSVGKTIDFCCETKETDCCPSLIMDAFLNLISNSAKFSKSDKIYVSLYTKGDGNIITVENEGSINCADTFRNVGINAAGRVASLHGGRLFYASAPSGTKAAISFPSVRRAYRKYDVPSFSAFLSDEFSSVQVGLSDVFL